MATTEHLEHLERANINQIAPFVNQVTFVAPPNSWTLTYDGFKDVVVAQAIRKYADDHLNGYCGYGYENDGHRKFVEKHWSGTFPLSDEEIRGGFNRYHDDALLAKDLLQGEDLRVAWTKALRALPSGLGLRFVSFPCDVSSSTHLPIQPDCIVRPHHHDAIHQRETCIKATASIGDALFAAAIACLAEAGVKARKLNVTCAMTGEFQWEALPGWGTCDFSRVQSFKFQPQVQDIIENFNYFGEVDTLITKRAADATAAVLKKCNDSLEEFHYQDFCPMRWPGHEVISLPKLKRLSLSSGYIRPRNLKTWMAKMPSLERFECVMTKSCGGGEGTWLEVFDAIRNHPRGIKVDFDQIVANDEEISIDYHTDDFQEYLENEALAEDWSDVCMSLPLYLSGKIDMDEETLEASRAW